MPKPPPVGGMPKLFAPVEGAIFGGIMPPPGAIMGGLMGIPGGAIMPPGPPGI
jgi:hypothetical protein